MCIFYVIFLKIKKIYHLSFCILENEDIEAEENLIYLQKGECVCIFIFNWQN